MSEIAKYKDSNRYNLLVATQTVQQISPFHAMRLEEVKISTNLNDGDIFKVGSRNERGKWIDLYSLTKVPLLKMAKAAGIVWNWSETKIVSATRDYVIYQAVAAIRTPSGEYIPAKGTKEIDLLAVEAETKKSKREALEKLSPAELKKKLGNKSFDDYLESEVEGTMIQWRKNKIARAETGAMLRAVKALLTIKSTYTMEELEKPFVVPRIDFSPDYNDPNVRSMLLNHGMKAASELFGMNSQMNLTPAPAFEIPQVQEEPAIEVLPPEEPELQEPEPEQQEEDPDACRECGQHVSPKVKEFSVRRYGAAYCMDCQKGRQ